MLGQFLEISMRRSAKAKIIPFPIPEMRLRERLKDLRKRRLKLEKQVREISKQKK
jgi:hypothetical protein